MFSDLKTTTKKRPVAAADLKGGSRPTFQSVVCLLGLVRAELQSATSFLDISLQSVCRPGWNETGTRKRLLLAQWLRSHCAFRAHNQPWTSHSSMTLHSCENSQKPPYMPIQFDETIVRKQTERSGQEQKKYMQQLFTKRKKNVFFKVIYENFTKYSDRLVMKATQYKSYVSEKSALLIHLLFICTLFWKYFIFFCHI